MSERQAEICESPLTHRWYCVTSRSRKDPTIALKRYDVTDEIRPLIERAENAEREFARNQERARFTEVGDELRRARTERDEVNGALASERELRIDVQRDRDSLRSQLAAVTAERDEARARAKKLLSVCEELLDNATLFNRATDPAWTVLRDSARNTIRAANEAKP